MAWLLGLGALAGGGYLISVVDDYVTEKTKPMYDYFENEKVDEIERIKELSRQEQINDIKHKKVFHDELRTKYNLSGSGFILLNNNTNEVCYVVYVNHYSAKNKEEAIMWAKKVVDMEYFKLGLSNKLNTKKEYIGVHNNLQFIQKEFDDYYIVLAIGDKYVIFEKPTEKNLNISKLLQIKNEHDVDTQCRWI